MQKCDRELWEKGEHIASLDARSEAAETWVKHIALVAAARVDWHYVGGVACVRFLGSPEDRARVEALMDANEHWLDGRVMQRFRPDDTAPVSVIPWPLFDVPQAEVAGGDGE